MSLPLLPCSLMETQPSKLTVSYITIKILWLVPTSFLCSFLAYSSAYLSDTYVVPHCLLKHVLKPQNSFPFISYQKQLQSPHSRLSTKPPCGHFGFPLFFSPANQNGCLLLSSSTFYGFAFKQIISLSPLLAFQLRLTLSLYLP